MSNVHEVRVVAEVPFNWLNDIEPTDARFLINWLYSPSIGLRAEYEEIGYVKNSHGGRTCMYQLTITGREAMSYVARDELMRILRKYGRVEQARARDVENNTACWDM